MAYYVYMSFFRHSNDCTLYVILELHVHVLYVCTYMYSSLLTPFHFIHPFLPLSPSPQTTPSTLTSIPSVVGISTTTAAVTGIVSAHSSTTPTVSSSISNAAAAAAAAAVSNNPLLNNYCIHVFYIQVAKTYSPDISKCFSERTKPNYRQIIGG